LATILAHVGNGENVNKRILTDKCSHKIRNEEGEISIYFQDIGLKETRLICILECTKFIREKTSLQFRMDRRLERKSLNED
jgi:hypothetical protein